MFVEHCKYNTELKILINFETIGVLVNSRSKYLIEALNNMIAAISATSPNKHDWATSNKKHTTPKGTLRNERPKTISDNATVESQNTRIVTVYVIISH